MNKNTDLEINTDIKENDTEKTKKEKDNITVLCTKLKLYPLGDKDEVNRVYKYIRDGQYAQYRTMNLLMGEYASIGKTPVEMMESVINSERYLPITIYDDGFDETLFS